MALRGQESTSSLVPVPLAFLVFARWPEISITARGRVEIHPSVAVVLVELGGELRTAVRTQP